MNIFFGPGKFCSKRQALRTSVVISVSKKQVEKLLSTIINLIPDEDGIPDFRITKIHGMFAAEDVKPEVDEVSVLQ